MEIPSRIWGLPNVLILVTIDLVQGYKPDFGTASNLKPLILVNNRFSGKLPSEPYNPANFFVRYNN